MPEKNVYQGVVQELKRAQKEVKSLPVWVGCDATVDKIVAAVDKRHGPGEAYRPIKTLAELGKRITAAAGRSTNIELYLKQEKIGGNAAILAGAALRMGAGVTLVGDVGAPHEVFGPLKAGAKLYSVGEPTETHAVECQDGKLMLGYTRNHEAITHPRVVKAVGGLAKLRQMIEDSRLVALVNWTMTPGMTEIYKRWAKEVLPGLQGERVYFFDLADPEKRSRKELTEALRAIAQWEKHGQVVLGVNWKEAEQVAAALELPTPKETPAGIEKAAKHIREKLGISTVVIHTVKAAGCATEEGTAWTPGPWVRHPKLTTGAGDHFNAGFALAMTAGVSPQGALMMGVATSGKYVREGKSPTWAEALALVEEGW